MAGELQAPSGFCLPSAGIPSAGRRAEHYEYLGPGAQTQALTLARQALHRLNHFPSLYFEVLLLNLLVAGFPSSQADKCASTHGTKKRKGTGEVDEGTSDDQPIWPFA